VKSNIVYEIRVSNPQWTNGTLSSSEQH